MSGRADAAGSDDPFQNDDSIPLLTEVVPLRRPGEPDPRHALGESGRARQSDDVLPAPRQLPERVASAPPALSEAPSAGPSAAPSTGPFTAAAASAPPAAVAPANAATIAGLSQADWDALAERIERGVTARMLAQAGPMLENSLQTLVAPLIEQAAVQIAHDLHDVFSHLVQDLVARAVAEELALLQAREDEPAPPESH